MEWQVVEKPDAKFYHNGTRALPNRNKDGSIKAPPIEERTVIAWDMEGMSLSGELKPQHPVVFGCSSEPEKVLVSQKLGTMEMLEYIIDVASRNPFAIHVGYGFRYDANMIVQFLPEKLIARLWTNGEARFGRWYIRWVPGKMFTVSRRGEKWHAKRNKKDKVSVTIYDYSSFFGGSKFITSAEEILRESLSEEDRDTIQHGKDARGQNTWEDLDEVLYYWKAEIQLIRRTFETFRDVMCKAGFPLREWYGPGALANFINARHEIRPKLCGVQITSGLLPNAVHEASKRAFSGGRFELFQAGRTVGPIYAVDINSAYPYALTMIPSFAEGTGEWVHVENPTHIERFGFYRIAYHAPNSSPFDTRPMPLFWRDNLGLISFPNRVQGWYASPEARMVNGAPGARISEGWVWRSPESDFPWQFLREMYQTRMRLGKSNLLSIPFKLGPNSLYGKYAQTVGWDREKKLPPKSHALPVAAWITSFTRAKLWSVIRQIPERVIAVETDSVFFTGDPSDIDLQIGDELGQWSIKEYEELVYIQSGMYHTKQGGEWTGTKSRGLSRAEYPFEKARDYLSGLVPGEEWRENPLKLTTKPRFIGAGAAINSAAPFKTQHCAWVPQKRELTLGETGKRRHAAAACQACQHGESPWDAPHRLVIGTRSDGETLSFPRRLPWESNHTSAVEEIRRLEMLDREMSAR
jgi:hypothetical protein